MKSSKLLGNCPPLESMSGDKSLSQLGLYIGMSSLEHLFIVLRHFHSADRKFNRVTFVFVTSIAGTPLFTTNGHVFKVLRKRAPKTCPKAPSGSTLTSGQPVLSGYAAVFRLIQVRRYFYC